MRAAGGVMLDRAIRLAGGEPARVRPLARALIRAAEGRIALGHRKRSGVISPQGQRILLLVVVALGSVMIAGLMLIGGRRPFAVAGLLAVVHWVLLLVVGVTRSAPSLVADRDDLVIRLLGRRTARRLTGLASDGAVFLFLFLVLPALARRADWLIEHGRSLALLLPPLWFAAWGALLSDPRAPLLAGLGLAVTGLLVALGFRLLAGSAQTAETLETTPARPRRGHWSDLAAAALRPWTPGREGWAVRRLLLHHLREDWRFLGTMALVPVMYGVLALLAVVKARATGAPEVGATALIEIQFWWWVAFFAPYGVFMMQYSGRPRALWVVALADLDAGRLLAAQRGILRGLILAPMLLIYAAQAARLGAGLPTPCSSSSSSRP